MLARSTVGARDFATESEVAANTLTYTLRKRNSGGQGSLTTLRGHIIFNLSARWRCAGRKLGRLEALMDQLPVKS
jgi:hypothetical protein